MTDTPTERRLRVRYVDLDSIQSAERNPKLHDLAAIRASLTRFGIADAAAIVNETTGRIVAGHGRVTTLRDMRDTGDPAPEGVTIDSKGRWKVPVISGVAFDSDSDAEAFLLAHNRTTELGGWNPESLDDVLSDLHLDGALHGTGFTFDLGEADPDESGKNPYTDEINPPLYEPTRDTPPEISEMLDTDRRDSLEQRIDEASIPAEVASFLRVAATRHIRFNYAAIAEFYAHADPAIQALMEESALVIIDHEQAIQHGFLKLDRSMQDILNEELDEP